MSDNKIALNFRLTIYIRYKDNNTGKAMSLVLCFVPRLNKIYVQAFFQSSLV